MESDSVWIKQQQVLAEASRNDYWLRTLSPEKRAALGQAEYRKRCRLAKQRVKLAGAACVALVKDRQNALGHGRAVPAIMASVI